MNNKFNNAVAMLNDLAKNGSPEIQLEAATTLLMTAHLAGKEAPDENINNSIVLELPQGDQRTLTVNIDTIINGDRHLCVTIEGTSPEEMKLNDVREAI